MSPRDHFKSFLPESTYLDLQHPQELIKLCYQNSWINPVDKILSIEKPGEGNMNFVVRVKTSSISIVIMLAASSNLMLQVVLKNLHWPHSSKK